MTIKKWDDGQLEFDLGLDEVEDDARDRAIPYDESRMISEAARRTFEGGELPKWYADYHSLIEQGWPWRVAAYIAWSSSPKSLRRPETLQKLATDVLGLAGPRVIYTWRKRHPTLDETISMLQTKALWEHRQDVVKAMIDSATGDYKGYHDRRLYFEMTGDYTPKSKLEIGKAGKAEDIHEKTDAELRRWVGDEEDDGDDELIELEEPDGE